MRLVDDDQPPVVIFQRGQTGGDLFGIVGEIINDGDVFFRHADGFQTPVNPLERRQGFQRLRRRNADLHRRADRRQSVRDVMTPDNRQKSFLSVQNKSHAVFRGSDVFGFQIGVVTRGGKRQHIGIFIL